jgi:transcriptional regulator with XRE-family HTH domain
MTIDEIREALRDRKLTLVAQATGLHENTIYRIASGRNQNPSYDTIRKLVEYLSK